MSALTYEALPDVSPAGKLETAAFAIWCEHRRYPADAERRWSRLHETIKERFRNEARACLRSVGMEV